MNYFATLLIFIVSIVIFIRTFYITGQIYPIDVGSVTDIFNRLSCIQIPNNSNQSFKTFMSVDALVMGIIGTVGNIGALFMDQSFWQLNSAASPKKSGLAFVVAGFIWFFVRKIVSLIRVIIIFLPFKIGFVFGTPLSIAYAYYNSYSEAAILSDDDISAGRRFF